MSASNANRELTQKGKEKMNIAEAQENLANRLRNAESIAEDVPELSTLFHKVRTSKRRARDGRFVALMDYDIEKGEWSCRNVSFLQQGTHYRDTGADAILPYKPFPLLSVDEFSKMMAANLERKAQAKRENAYNYRKEF